MRKISKFFASLFCKTKKSEENSDNFSKDEKDNHIRPEPEKKCAIPYVFTVCNDGETEQEAILYGYTQFNDCKNYGSGENIRIVPAFDVPYKHHLINSAFKPFEFIAFRVSSDNMNLIKKNVLEIVYEDVNGRKYIDNNVVLSSFENIFQNAHDIIDAMYPTKINHMSFLRIKVPAKTEFTLSIWPSKIWDATHSFVGLNPLHGFNTPILSGKVENIYDLKKGDK